MVSVNNMSGNGKINWVSIDERVNPHVQRLYLAIHK